MALRSALLVPGGVLSLSLLASDARADVAAPSLGGLLGRLAQHAARFEQMKTRGAYTLTGHMEELDGDGRTAGRKDMELRMIPTGGLPLTDILRYAEDGVDKTADARTKAAERKKDPSAKRREFHLPFLAGEQSRYVFAVVERDAQSPNNVRIAFVPRAPAEDAYKGSAWVDEAEGEVLSMGFSPSKNPSFIDHVDATLVFALSTPLGRAPSKLTFDAIGGFLFVRKHYRGWVTVSGASLPL